MEEVSVFEFCAFVGAYCIRPVRHRMNRIANLHPNIAKSAQFRAYATRPYSGASYCLYALYLFTKAYNIRPHAATKGNLPYGNKKSRSPKEPQDWTLFHTRN